MPSIQRVGGRSIVIPQLIVDDPSTAAARVNWAELNAAMLAAGGNNGEVILPAGIVAATFSTLQDKRPILKLDERHAGITIRGAGRAKTLLYDPLSADTPVLISSRAITNFGDGTFVNGSNAVTAIADISLYSVGHVRYFWVHDSGLRTYRQKLRVAGVDPGQNAIVLNALIDQTPAVNRFEHARGFELTGTPTAGNTRVKLIDPAYCARFQIGDDAAITDGPAYDEVYSEFVRVTGIESSTGNIDFFPPLRRNYMEDKACLVPPPHMTDITIRDLSVAPPINSTARYVGAVRMGLRLAFENFAIVPAPEDPSPGLLDFAQLNFANVQELRLQNCRFALPTFNISQDALVTGCYVRGWTGEELTNDVQFIGSTFDGPTGFRFDTANSPGGACKRIHLTACRILNYASPNGVVAFNEDSSITDVEVVPAPDNTATIYLSDDAIRLTNVVIVSPLVLQGRHFRIANLTAPSVTLSVLGTVASSGVFLSPLLPPTATITDATGTPGNWLVPMMARSDGLTFNTGVANFPAGLTANNIGATHPLRFWQTFYDAGQSAAALQPVSSQAVTCVFQLIPSASSTASGGSAIQFLNQANGSQAGFLILGVAGAEGRIEAYNPYTPRAVTSFLIELPTKVRALASQSADLQQWQDENENPLFAIRVDGNLASAKTETDTLPSTVARRLPLYSISGTPLGYIPVHKDP